LDLVGFSDGKCNRFGNSIVEQLTLDARSILKEGKGLKDDDNSAADNGVAAAAAAAAAAAPAAAAEPGSVAYDVEGDISRERRMKSLPPHPSIPSPISFSFSLSQQNASSFTDAGNPGSMVRSLSRAFPFTSHITGVF
jgi:hypothetical protein